MKKWKYHCALLLYVCMGVSGVLFSLTNAFDVEYKKAEVLSIVLIVSGMTTMLFLLGKKIGTFLAWMIPVGGILVLYLTQRVRVRESFLYMKECVLTTLEEYLKIYLGSSGNMSGTAELGVVMCGFVIGVAIACGIVCMKRAWLVGMLLGISILIPFAVGKVPQMAETVLCLLVVPGIVSEKTGRKFQVKRQSGLIGMILAIVALGVGSLFAGTHLQDYVRDKKEISQRISRFLEKQSLSLFEKGKGGVGDGEVGGVGTFAKDDTKQLVVTTKTRPKEKIYLQGYIGTIYEDNRWNRQEKSNYESWLAKQGAQKEEVKNLLYQTLKKFVQEETLYIENVGANQEYKYIPYGGYYTEEDEIVDDMYVKGAEKSYEVPYCPLVSIHVQELEKIETPLESSYLEYVWKRDTQVPKRMEQSFADEVGKYVMARDNAGIMQEVRETLERQASYSLHPGKTPKGKDVAEYFYFENKKGYCEHFATVATLMLRMKGIPARYVAGYVVKPSAFVKNDEEMYEAVVTGASAHAWAEAYVQGVGWIPVETTPGYSENSRIETEEQTAAQQPQQDEPQQEAHVEQEKEETDAKQNTVEGGGTKENENEASGLSRYILLGMVMIILLTVAALIVGRRIWIQKKWKIGRKKGYGDRLRALFYSMCELLALAGKIKKSETVDEGFVQKLCEAYPSIPKAEAQQVLELVYRESFGNEKIQKEEYQMCQKLYQQIKKEVSVDISFWKKIWWKYWYGISL